MSHKPGHFASRLIHSWICELERSGKAANTVFCYQDDMGKFDDFLIRRKLKVEDVTAPDVRDFFDSVSGSLATKNRRLSTLRSFFKHLQRRKLVEGNPMCGCTLPPPPKKPQRTLTEEEIELIVEVSKGELTRDARRNYAVILLLVTTGIKLTQAGNLNVSDYSDGFLRVGEDRRIKLTPECCRAIEDHRRAAELRHESGSQLFSNRDGTRMSGRGFRLLVAKISKAALGFPVQAEAFRRTRLKNMIRQGCNARQVQEELGYKNLRTACTLISA